MDDDPLTAKDRAFIMRYGLSCWSRAVTLDPVKVKRPETEKDPNKVYEYQAERPIKDSLPSPFGFGA